MPYYTSCSFDVQLKEDVTVQQIRDLVEQTFGKDEFNVIEGKYSDSSRHVMVHEGELSFYIGATVSYGFEDSFNEFCSKLAPLVEGAFRTDLESDDGPSAAGDVTTRYWAENENDALLLEQMDAMSDMSATAERVIAKLPVAKAGWIQRDEAAVQGATFLIADAGSAEAEPAVSVDLAYVNDPKVAEFITRQAELLANLIATAKGASHVLAFSSKLMPSSMPIDPDDIPSKEPSAQRDRG